jgi:hypothetical protein
MFENIKAKLLFTTARSILIAKKFSPEILVGTGVVSLLGCAVFAHNAKPKAMTAMDEHTKNMGIIEEAKVTLLGKSDDYTEKDYRKDLIIQKRNTIVTMVKIYAPAVITGALGVTSILCAFGIVKKRNVALIGAYKLMSKSYSEYRARVIDKYGAEEDRLFKNGITKGEATAVTLDENGDSQLVEPDIINPNELSIYSKFFDEGSMHWSKTVGYNRMFVQAQQDFANDLVTSRGHVLLNEVYDTLGIPRTPEGAIVGWVRGEGDGFIDFGLFNPASIAARNFVNGVERTILLDFNVQGVVYDLI